MSSDQSEWNTSSSSILDAERLTGGRDGGSPYRRDGRSSTRPSDIQQPFGHTNPTDIRDKPTDSDRYMEALGDLTFSIISVVSQRALVHPCLVFRNQCQLNTRLETGYKLLPWSIVSPLRNIYKNQGALSLWKGLHNDLFISIVRKSIEMVLSENSSLPISLEGSPRANVVGTYTKHMLLKTISTVLATPLICAGYTLRVQSQVVVGETNYLSIFSEAYHRLISSLYSHNSETSHLLPLYKLVTPITVLFLGSYVIHGMSTATIQRQYQLNTIELNDMDHDEIPMIKTVYDRYYPQLLGAFSGQFIADVFFYPLSTITGRLILQGTRTIIDDVETGNAVLPFTSTYTGVLNCMRTIVAEEGVFGLYKGFGALVMQYTVQALILRGTHLLYERIMETHYPRVPRRRIYTPATPSSTHSSVTSLNTRP